jgi:hypothetical protein
MLEGGSQPTLIGIKFLAASRAGIHGNGNALAKVEVCSRFLFVHTAP